MPVITSLFNRVILLFFCPVSLPHTHTDRQWNYRQSQVYLFCPFSCIYVGKCLVLIYSTLRSDWITLMGTSITEHGTRKKKNLTKHLRSHYSMQCWWAAKIRVWAGDIVHLKTPTRIYLSCGVNCKNILFMISSMSEWKILFEKLLIATQVWVTPVTIYISLWHFHSLWVGVKPLESLCCFVLQ